MTNGIAVALVLAVAAFFVADWAFGWQAHIGLGRWFADVIAWLAFWR